MKLSKEQIGNGIWILAIIILVFTPVGFHARVLVGKIFASSADIVTDSKQKTLTDYDWILINSDKEQSNFEGNRGKVVLVNFWATWCPPCVAEMPSLQKLYDHYGDRVEFVFVANDHLEKVEQFLKKKQYQLPVYYEVSQTPDALMSKSIPATYILSKSGKIVVDEKGAANWNSEKIRNLLEELLKEKPIF